MSKSDEPKGGRVIQLDSLSLQELDQMKQREEIRANEMLGRYSQLRQLGARLEASRIAVQDLKMADRNENQATQSLIPLTDSVYIPARNVVQPPPQKLLIELGTGYFCEKDVKETLDYLERKRKIVDANSDNVMKIIQSSRQNIQAIQSTMEGKLLEIRAKQEGNRYRASVEGS